MAEASPWLVVGLGNPGSKYARNRHNIGFMVAERWVDRFGAPGLSEWREKFHGRFASVSVKGERCVALMPQTFMNRSGQSVAAAATFYRVPPQQLIVIHDELDFEFGRLAIKKDGGHGGHNGLRDIIAATGASNFVRIRIGIGRPSNTNMDVAAWVLQDFSADDAAVLPDVVDRALEAALAVVTQGVATAMNKVNQNAPKDGPSGPSADSEAP